jgi:hypothetical protein
MGNAHQLDARFYNVLLCHLAADSYDPEALKELLKDDPKFSAAFRRNLAGLIADENWSVAVASKDLNYGFKNADELRIWVADLDSFLFGDGPVP